MNNEINLLPCPFCGGKAEPFNPFNNIEGTWCILCYECAAVTGFEQTKEEAAVAWNARVTEYDYPQYEQKIKGYGSNWYEIMCDAYDNLIAAASVACTRNERREFIKYIKDSPCVRAST